MVCLKQETTMGLPNTTHSNMPYNIAHKKKSEIFNVILINFQQYKLLHVLPLSSSFNRNLTRYCKTNDEMIQYMCWSWFTMILDKGISQCIILCRVILEIWTYMYLQWAGSRPMLTQTSHWNSGIHSGSNMKRAPHLQNNHRNITYIKSEK